MGCVWAGRGRTTCNQAPATAAGAREGKIIPRHNEMLEIDGMVAAGGGWYLVTANWAPAPINHRGRRTEKQATGASASAR